MVHGVVYLSKALHLHSQVSHAETTKNKKIKVGEPSIAAVAVDAVAVVADLAWLQHAVAARGGARELQHGGRVDAQAARRASLEEQKEGYESEHLVCVSVYVGLVVEYI